MRLLLFLSFIHSLHSLSTLFIISFILLLSNLLLRNLFKRVFSIKLVIISFIQLLSLNWEILSSFPYRNQVHIISLFHLDSIRIARHYSRGFPIYDDNIAPLFLLLSSKNIITILQLLLLEQKVLLHSYYPALIINVAHTLKRLLFPWKYAGSFIPLLPSSMLLAVQVPGSYIIGVETVIL